MIFSPIIHDDKCYLDGGFFLNYPISKCVENVENVHEILGISLRSKKVNTKPYLFVNSESNILDLLNVLLNRIINNIDFISNNKKVEIPYEIYFFSKQDTTIDYCLQVLYSKEDRQELIYNGILAFKEKYKEWSNTVYKLR